MWGLTEWFYFVISMGAVSRLAILITKDAVFDGPRLWVINRLVAGWWLKLWTCPSCMSMWVAFAVVPCAYFLGTSLWFVLPALALTLSQVTGLVAAVMDFD